MENRTTLGVMFGVLVSAAVIGQERAQRPGPAAGLYQLVLAEWQACRDKGVKLPSDQHRDLRRNGLNVVLVQANAPTPDDETAAWQAVAESTAVVRDLLQQAASAPVGEWSVPAGAEGLETALRLQELSELIARLAHANLDLHPDTAIWTALVLLQHARHLQATTSAPFVTAGHATARRAASLLQAALVKIPDDHAHAALCARSIEAIDRFLTDDFDQEAVQKALRAGIAPRLEAHRSRLRDMHQTTPGGYDDERMRAAIEGELDRLLAESDRRQRQSGRPWLVELRELALDPGRRERADVTTMAARGIVDLLLCGVTGSSREDTAYLDTLVDCRDTLAQRRRPQASESK